MRRSSQERICMREPASISLDRMANKKQMCVLSLFTGKALENVLESRRRMSLERKELAERLRHISQLTERLMSMPHENDEARDLAAWISREIEIARQQLKQLPPPRR